MHQSLHSRALWILAMQVVVAYYYCALKSVHDGMKSASNAPPNSSDLPANSV